MNKRLISILLLILFLFNLIPLGSSFIVGPGVTYVVLNGASPDELYAVDRNIDFNNISLLTYWISFNSIGFNLSGNNKMWINLSQIASAPRSLGLDNRVISFNVSAPVGTHTSINLSSLKSQHTYRLYNETGTTNSNLTTNLSGKLRWNLSSGMFTTHHTWSYRLYDFNGSAPTVTTNVSTGVLETNATLNGYLNNAGFGFSNKIYTNYTTGGDGAYHSSNEAWMAQTFIPTTSHYIKSITLLLRRFGSPGKLNVSIKATSGGLPTGINLTNGTTNGNTLPLFPDLEWREVTMTVPYYLVSGTKYAIVVTSSIPNTALDYFSWYADTGDSLYTDGNGIESADGHTWIIGAPGPLGDDVDFMFEESGNYTASVYFQYGLTTSYGTNTTAQQKSSGQHFSQNIGGLSSSTLYHYRAAASNSIGHGYGLDMMFITKPNAPTNLVISRQGVTGFNVSWTKEPGANKTVVRYKTTGFPTSPTDGTGIYNNTGSYFIQNGLVIGTTYYYSLWSYFSWGSSHQFSNVTTQSKTFLVNPSVTTVQQTGTNSTNSTLRGTITGTGGVVNTVGFNYGTTSSYGNTLNLTGHSKVGSTATTSNDLMSSAYKTRFAMKITLFSGIPMSANFALSKSGSPTGNLYARVRLVSDDSIVTESSPKDVSTLTGVVTWYNFSFATPVFVDNKDIYVSIEYADGSGVNYVNVYMGGIGNYYRYDGAWNVIAGGNLALDFIYKYHPLGESFYYDATGLSPATIYHFRATASNSNGTGYGSDRKFLTRPLAPILFTATPQLGSFKLSWTNPDIGVGVNRSVYIRYKAGSSPTSITDGLLLVNKTSLLDTDSYTAPGLLGAYGFSIWTYVNSSTLHMFSYDFASSSGSLGGCYNITIRYENWSQGFVNLSKYGPHRIVFYSANTTNEMYIQGYTTWGDLKLNLSRGSIRHQLTHGYLAINISMNPYQVEFQWNTTMSSDTVQLTQRFYGFSIDTSSTASTTDRFFGYLTKNYTLKSTTEKKYGYSTGVIVSHTLTEKFYGYSYHQNLTYTYIQLSHSPVNKSVCNVTCFNASGSGTSRKSYPAFLLSGDTITINPYTARGFTQVNVTYTYTTGSPFSQNETTTQIQLAHTPVNYSSTNVTCYNALMNTKSYPLFLIVGDTIVINPNAAKNFTQVNITYVYGSGSMFSQNSTTTIIQLNHSPINKSSTNVTCYNIKTHVKSYPVFILSDNVITIYPDMAKNFTQINVTYTYPTGGSFSQNETTTVIQLDHTPISIGLVNVTCYNSVTHSKSYPPFLLNVDQVVINQNLADEFTQVNITYSYRISYSNYRCNRMLVRTSGYNLSFYIITNRYLYDGVYVSSFNNTLVKWVYNFIDNTGIFLNKPGIDTYAYIYTFSPNGTRIIIHSEYLDSYKKIYPELLYGKKYYIGISCSVASIDRIGFAPTEIDNTRTTSVYVIIDVNNSISFPEYTIKSDYSAGATGLYVYYSDPFLSVVSSWLRVYDYNNGSIMYVGTSSASVKNYSFIGALHNRSYEIYLVINSSDQRFNLIYVIYLVPGSTARWSYAIINDTLTLIFGYTPFRSYENPSGKAIVPWTDVLVFAVFCILLFSIAGYNAALSGIASGGWFVFAGAMISGSPAIFITIGIIILLMSFLYAWGDRS